MPRLRASSLVAILLFVAGAAWFSERTVVTQAPNSTPYGGTPRPLPGIVQAEDFDAGANGEAYLDTTSGNTGGQYRATDVDIEATTDVGGGYNLSKTRPGEWLNYTVTVAAAGTYRFSARVAANGGGGTFHAEFGGVNKTGALVVPNTGAWQAWTTLTQTVTLAAGTQVMRIVLDTSGTSSGVCNLNWVRLESIASSQPYGGTPRPLPGIVQAEDFDAGANGEAYRDTTSGNTGGQYRATDVDIQATADTGGGYNVGWMTAGEWLHYTVNVTAAGTYTLSARVAANGPGGTFHVEFDGVDRTGPLVVPNTGGWQAWTTVSAAVTLSAGTQVMKVVLDVPGSTNIFGNLNFLSIAGGPPADVLSVVKIRVDPPTLHTLGVQVLIAGDENRNGSMTVRYREVGAIEWRSGPPLLRVWPETIAVAVPEQFAGSIFDLSPATTYEIELTAADPDGHVNELHRVTAATRPVPRDTPATPRAVVVTDTGALKTAFSGARAGDVITVRNGTYAGPFLLAASGTPTQPIVVRGESSAGVVLTGGGCTTCLVLQVAGSFVHVERLTIADGRMGLGFTGLRATGNVARRLEIRNVIHGTAANTGQSNFYICDNVLDGRLQWPWVFASDAMTHWDDRGVEVNGDGHVICHNSIRGFGDPVVNKKRQSRAWDVYGNDIADAWDGVELDEAEGNVRLFHNRFTNLMAPISIQPVFGGPAYVLRNVSYNAADEPIKLKSYGGVEMPSGALVYHNTFVSPKRALNLLSTITQHNFVIGNNLFVGPTDLAPGAPDPVTGAEVGERSVDWRATINGGVFDYNGYYPDGPFMFGTVDGVNRLYPSFGQAQAAGVVERRGVLLTPETFQSGYVGPADEWLRYAPLDVTLAAGSNAIDRGQFLAGINEGFTGAAPDLGALEQNCPVPEYGPRAEGLEAFTSPINCGTAGGY